MFAGHEIHRDIGASFVEEQDGIGTVGVAVPLVGEPVGAEAFGPESYGSGKEDLGAVRNVVIMRVAGNAFERIVRGRNGHGAVTGRASAGAVGAAVVVKHQVPKGHALAVAAQGAQENIPEIIDQAG